MSILSFQIQNGHKVIVPWTIISSFSVTDTFADLFKSVCEKNSLERFVLLKCKIGRSKVENGDDVEINVRVSEAVAIFGRYVRFLVGDESIGPEQLDPGTSKNTQSSQQIGDATNLSQKQNAFSVLMQASKKLLLPDKYEVEDNKIRNNKRLLRNKVIDTLRDASLGFTYGSLQSGENFVNVFTNALWYIDPFIEGMEARACNIPLLFEHLTGYNNPDQHKHKKVPIDNQTLQSHASNLEIILEQTWISGPMWIPMYNGIKTLVESMYKYSDYLKKHASKSSSNHDMLFPIRNLDDTQTVKVIHPRFTVKPTFSSRYKALNDHLGSLDYYHPVCVDEYTPSDRRNRRYYIDNLHMGLTYKCVFLRIARGSNLGTHNFLWRIPISSKDEEYLTKNPEIIMKITKDLPLYHTRAMRREFVQKAALIHKLPSHSARQIYKHLTNDQSASRSSEEAAVDSRAAEAFLLGDPDILVDLREHNGNKKSSKYDTFFLKTKEHIESVIEEAVDDRRHDKLTHLATAISVPDLLRQVAKKCPPDTPIPSAQWLRLQFAPKVSSSYTSLQYTGQLNVKFQVQSRQLRKEHVDCHYASAIFHYQKEMAVKFRDFSTFICMDDKHHCKVGEPGCPVAAVDRGKKVIVSKDKVFAVADHDFTKFSIVPSVTMLLDLPTEIHGSFYRGQVYVGVKDLALEPSSPIRHITELNSIVKAEQAEKPILFLYTDGGPDHRLTYLSVQLSLLCIFIAGDYDMIVAARTPPMSSWKNPPERIMSILNLALQSVGLMRQQVSEECEKKLSSVSGINQIRGLAADPELRSQIQDSIEPVKVWVSEFDKSLYYLLLF